MTRRERVLLMILEIDQRQAGALPHVIDRLAEMVEEERAPLRAADRAKKLLEGVG